ncbi:type IX secretion system PorP/SprF family membrane protein [Arcticibacter tournemirensis]|uniref:Type IX secretion system membrane protein PorP/SprF n=1 Tax=Arcticibacter tournemirensis TaxID=699437 RepID=A0A5M9HKJ0_9SPHI|nr:PorP/SprF family type IX secretion system membrane protein [Arcticibacter tournemirensis]KAA8485938.1 type IX secretion system membrane protein PorP/SprF [Arcticibacter tournemirensis]TQM46803.1 type IX secretion system PorP/SprF family membrane protein [Arcticibacter tournemirensis]
MKRFFTVLVFLVHNIAFAQDHIYSQFYNSPNYLNPALNGQFEGDLRMNLIYRNQWSGVPGGLDYFTFSVDYTVPKLNGGLGFLATSSNEGTAYLRKLNLSGIYSYSVSFEEAVLSFGVQAGFTKRKIDYGRIVFGDQIDALTGIIPGSVTDATVPAMNNKYFFDAGAGINLVAGKFMIGTSAQHINKPNESFTGLKATLPMRLNGHVSYRLPLDRYDEETGPVVIPSIVFYKQAESKLLSTGFQYKYKAANVGLWYRSESGTKGDAVVLSLIFDLFVKKDMYDKVRMGVSHDATLSKLQYGNTAGSTEGALSYETTFPNRNSAASEYRNSSGNRCYDFY